MDSFGFKELPSFLQPENSLKNAEMSLEDDYDMIDGIIDNGKNPIVAELEQQVKNGQPISLMELAQAKQRERDEKEKVRHGTAQKPDGQPGTSARRKRSFFL